MKTFEIFLIALVILVAKARSEVNYWNTPYGYSSANDVMSYSQNYQSDIKDSYSGGYAAGMATNAISFYGTFNKRHLSHIFPKTDVTSNIKIVQKKRTHFS